MYVKRIPLGLQNWGMKTGGAVAQEESLAS